MIGIDRAVVNFRRGVIALTCVVLTAAIPVRGQDFDERDDIFDELSTRIQQNSELATDGDVYRLLDLGKALGRNFAAGLALKTYIRRQADPSLELLHRAIESAVLSGDYQTAVARSKAYLKKAKPGQPAAETAATMYLLLIDYLRAKDDAYRFIKEEGGRFRASRSVRKFDAWFLGEAQRRGDVPAHAAHLAVIFAEKSPVESERLFYWDDLDWVMKQIRRPGTATYAATAPARRLIPLIRGDQRRKLRMSLLVENLAFFAASTGKENDKLQAEFARVIEAASAYLGASTTTKTLGDIIDVFSEGDPNRGWRSSLSKLRKQFFFQSFSRLSLEEQKKMLAWKWPGWNRSIPSYLASPDQWVQLVTKHPEAFRGHAMASKTLFSSSNDPQIYRQCAAVLGGVATREAAIIKSLAAGNTLDSALDHLIQKESWHLEREDIYTILKDEIWRRFSSYPRDDANKLPDDYFGKSIFRFGEKYVAVTPLALNTDAAKAYVYYAWRHSGKHANDKSQVARHLAALNWVPYDAEARKAIFQPAHTEFKQWSERIRTDSTGADTRLKALQKDLDAERQKLAALKQTQEQTRQAVIQQTQAKAAADPADAAKVKQIADRLKALQAKSADLAKQVGVLDKAVTVKAKEAAKEKQTVTESAAWLAGIGPLDEAFRRAMTLTMAARTAGPNPFCDQMAKLEISRNLGNRDGFLAAAREVVRLTGGDPPLGFSSLKAALTPPKDAEIVDFQCEVLAGVAGKWNPAGDNERYVRVANVIAKSKKGWNWGSIPKRDKWQALKLNVVLAKAIGDQMTKGHFPGLMFNNLIATRYGSGWTDYTLNSNLFERIITEETFLKSDYRRAGKTAAATYMWLMRHYHPGLNKKYPYQNAFNDMYIKEVAPRGILDFGYWDQSGSDSKLKIRDLAATMMQKYTTVSVGYGATPGDYTPTTFWRAMSYAQGATPAVRDAMLAKLDATFGTTRFDDYASGASMFSFFRISTKSPKRKAYFEKLAKTLERIKTIPGRPILYLYGLYDIRNDVKLDEIKILAEHFKPGSSPSSWRSGTHIDYVVEPLIKKLYPTGKKPDPLLFEMSAELWRLARDMGNVKVQKQLLTVGQRLMNDEHFDLAVAWSKAGLSIGSRNFADDIRGALRVLQSRALSNIRGVIPVKRTDPRYPLFASQANYNGGNVQGAWTEFLRGRDVLLEYFRELDPLFCTWLIDRNVDLENFDDAEALAREMIRDIESKTLRLPPEIRVQVRLARANIAFALPELPRARALYEQISAEKEFSGLDGQIDAELRIAEIDRVQKDYDGAMQRIEKVLRLDKPHAKSEGHFHMALVMRDQEQFEEAKRQIDEVFVHDVGHVKARLLEGRINLDLKQLERASDLDLGLSQMQKFVVPGKVLKVRVEDKLRRIAKRTSSIEISIEADSGDVEIFTLVPWADSLTRFEGSIETGLGPPNKGDRKLQLLGSDKVRYDFSARFKQQHNVQRETEHELQVISDSDLYASSGQILTGRELEEQREEEMIRARLQEAGRRLKKDDTLLSERRSGKQVKPGNQINVRVLDDDQSVSAGKDEVVISVTSSSGDKIDRLQLIETNTHVGVFDGVIQTESAPATAFATDSDEGTDPNFPVSGGDYPAWVALPDNKRPKLYGVDLNDSVFMSKMRIEAGVPGRKLKDFFLQTSLNGMNFSTIGSWPKPFKPWDGSPRGVMIKLGGKTPLPSGSAGLNQLDAAIADRPYGKRGDIRIDTLKASWDEGVFGHADRQRINWDVNHKETWYLARFSAAFYAATRQHRTFTLKTRNGGEHKADFLMTIDGELGTSQDSTGPTAGTKPTEYTGVFKKGAHRIDVYVIAPRRSKPGFEVHMDIEEAPYMALCPSEMFDTEKHPEIRRHIYRDPAVITPNEDGSTFNIAFGEGTRTRVVRLIMFDFETDAPAISRIHLEDIAGKKVLPTDEDLLALRKNQILEIIPGDTIKVTYQDPRHIGPNSKTREAFLSATFSNGRISPEMVLGYKQLPDGRRMPVRARMLRYKPGDAIDVTIADPDGDVSRQRDSVEVTIRTTEGQVRKLKALETEENTGLFEVRIFPVENEPQRDTEILVTESDDIVMEYVDTENTQPGIPWTRVGSVEQVWYQEPELRSVAVTSMPVTISEEDRAERLAETRIDEYYPITHEIVAIRPESPEDPGEPQTYVIGGPLSVELTWPTIAQTVVSKAELYVQTGRGRAVYGVGATNAYDINVPGTIKLLGGYGTLGGGARAPRGYLSARIIGTRFAGDPLDDGRFLFRVPVQLGKLPEESLAIDYEEEASIKAPENLLYINGSDTIHIGFRYTNDIGELVWIRRDYVLTADAFFDVMDRTYQQPIEGVYVDESVYFRVRDAMMDTTDRRDKIELNVKARSGATRDLSLIETESHSGVFKGLARLVYAEEGKLVEDYHEGEMPVRFGDEVTAAYTPTNGRPGVVHRVEVFKGSDGEILPFTKRFSDPEMAVKTMLSIAEAYFEMAKKHRKLKQKEITRHEIATGKKILEEALRDYPDSEARAQGDYLVANLALELGEEIKGDDERDEREQYYNEALMRFTRLIGQHRDSSYAPKAQFKKALTLERMGDFDAACEEYVKLSYRWPENELIAETIARLGQYFFRKGKQMQNVDSSDPVKVEMARLRSQKMFTSAAEVFGRLAERFPSHKLAEKTTVLSGQCYMRAENYQKAVVILAKVIDKKDAHKDVRAEAMYWCGDCYTKGKRFGNSRRPPMVEAYRMFKRVTWDYPSSKWAKYARGRLTEKDVASAGDDQ